MKLIIGFMIGWILCLGILYFIQPAFAAEPEPKKCNVHKVQKPIQSSTGTVFILKDGKWQIEQKS